MGLDFASGLAGAFGGARGLANARRLPKSDIYQPIYAQQADAYWWNAMEAIRQATDRNTGMVDPVILQSFSDLLGIDLAPLVQAGMQAGQQFGALGDTAGYFGDTMAGQAGGAFGRGADIWEAGRDPRRDLYERSRGDIIEGVRGADTARGVAMSPYSAGHETDALRDFEIDWQNQQLARMLAGGQGANAATGVGANALTSSMGYYGMEPGLTMQSAYAPIQAERSAYSMPMDWASMFTQAQGANVQGPRAQYASPLMPYVAGAAQIGTMEFGNDMQRAMAHNAMQQQSYYGIAGGGQSQGGNPYGNWGGNQSGFGNPMNWYGMGSMGAGTGLSPGGMQM